MNENIILKKSFELSVKIVGYTELLEEQHKYNMARQLFRSGTSIGANIHEAQSAESKVDFIHKLKIADKECHETLYWLNLASSMQSYPKDETIVIKLEEIMKLLNRIISTTKNNIKKKTNPN